jgi:deoxyribonuclease-4
MILFGTAGIPICAKGKGIAEGIREVKRLGLDAMEVEFVRGVRMDQATAKKARDAAREAGVALTVHAPYYINLCSLDAATAEASVQRVLAAARKCRELGGQSVTFHAAFYQGRDRDEIFRTVAGSLKEILSVLKKEGNKVRIKPELTGKPSQWGSLDELIRLGRAVRSVRPCIDFSHLVARGAGANNNYQEFCAALAAVKQGLGAGALAELHMHASGIEWTKKGERRHVMFEESRLQWKALLRALDDFNVSGIMLCESPVMEHDALVLKKEYRKLTDRKKR